MPVAARLGREAERLLGQLAEAGAYALADPIEPEMLILRGGGVGISLGGGRFAAASGQVLERAGLAEREGGRQQRLVLSDAGRARLRRKDWPAEIACLAQHLDLVVDTSGDGPVLRDASESPLAWMARRRGRDGAPLIDAAAYEAGERLRRDLTLAAMLPRTGPDWARPKVDGGGPRDPASASDRRIAAKSRVDRALEAVGNDLSGLLIDLCGFLKGLERIESERRWPARSAKVVARIALGRLAEHYGLGREATGPERSRTRLWRAAPKS
ncbi:MULTISPECIES: DUF6456 domain-containing protein [Methylobacterium]|uniref:DUF6456 domain-containing protein n=1 Tax=Methylobacterium sp. WL9 TaxID=2603898 RepID=UPI0011C9FDF8|nr:MULTISPECIES: DUF6456 domain-containing protein [Methylobacterium]TXN23687.1 ATPase [Methylobacterium sp. WL9]